MKTSILNLRVTIAFLLSACVLAGCGGTKVLKEPEPLVVTQSLATAADQRVTATLDWVVVRNGPGTWARNVDWDEYLIRVQNLSHDPIQITTITVSDSLGTAIESRGKRKQLVKGTKETKRRYKGEGLQVKAGAGAGVLIGAGAAVALAGAATVPAAFASSAAAGGVIAAAIVVPVLAVGGFMRGMNNRKVNNEIQSRQTQLPIVLQEDEEKGVDIFFPLSPSPRQIELTYVDSLGDHTLIIDTHTALEGLHLVSADK